MNYDKSTKNIFNPLRHGKVETHRLYHHPFFNKSFISENIKSVTNLEAINKEVKK